MGYDWRLTHPMKCVYVIPRLDRGIQCLQRLRLAWLIVSLLSELLSLTWIRESNQREVHPILRSCKHDFLYYLTHQSLQHFRMLKTLSKIIQDFACYILFIAQLNIKGTGVNCNVSWRWRNEAQQMVPCGHTLHLRVHPWVKYINFVWY